MAMAIIGISYSGHKKTRFRGPGVLLKDLPNDLQAEPTFGRWIHYIKVDAGIEWYPGTKRDQEVHILLANLASRLLKPMHFHLSLLL